MALIDAGADCAYRDETGAGAIIKACGSGCLSKNRKLLGKLVEKGASLNDQDETGLTALLVAIGRGKAEEVEKLIEAGADVNLADSEGTTPLIAAVKEKNKGIVDQLVRANADVNKIDEYNQSLDLAEGKIKKSWRRTEVSLARRSWTWPARRRACRWNAAQTALAPRAAVHGRGPAQPRRARADRRRGVSWGSDSRFGHRPSSQAWQLYLLCRSLHLDCYGAIDVTVLLGQWGGDTARRRLLRTRRKLAHARH